MKKIYPPPRLTHPTDMSEIVLLLSLGVLVLWILSPFATLVASHFPRLRKRLGLDTPVSSSKPTTR